MKRLILAGLFFAGTAEADPYFGQKIIFRYDSTHIYSAVVTKVLSSTQVNLVAFSNSTWYSGGPDGALVPAIYFGNVSEGANTDYHWIADPNGEGPQGPQGETGATGPGSNVSGISTPSLSLNGSAVQFDTSHDTIYTGVFSISGVISLTGGFDGLVNLLCDTNTTPTTQLGAVGHVATGTVVLGVSMTIGGYYTMSARVPLGHRCRLTTTTNSGTPSFSIVSQKLQTLAP